MPAVLQAFRIAFPTVCLPAPGNTRRVAVRSSGGHVAVILVTRKRSHPATIAYIERRVQEGKTRREANRCLKRYLARSLYRLLEHDATGDLTDIEASLAQAKSYGVQPARLPPLRRRRANTAQAATSKASRTLQTVSGN